MMTEKYPTWLIGHVKEWALSLIHILRNDIGHAIDEV